jgi:hypothetical protein
MAYWFDSVHRRGAHHQPAATTDYGARCLIASIRAFCLAGAPHVRRTPVRLPARHLKDRCKFRFVRYSDLGSPPANPRVPVRFLTGKNPPGRPGVVPMG